ncbi:alpha-(1,3)-fucosyltransferase C-like [Penaeus japonicus]|uniref:alpha-(1,3)-fucosyltransferase C-like n=1 Tax=Penaeus japonicus TaxID=27405 RepID=UPI001C711B1B|nr:alpha-(1,3)-fucosyltransferase C-like [Penaeus japonicus]
MGFDPIWISIAYGPKRDYIHFFFLPILHFPAHTDREKYAKELQKHIHIDVYGKCGSLVCGRNHRDTYCYTDVLSTGYLFYLAFENNLCRDYVTEKVFFAMLHGLVPIVYGGASYEDYLPPHSYIDARTLAPKDLAKLLVSAAESPEEYARYHLWRRYWRVTPFPPFCELCFKLHWDNSTTTVPDMASWWRSANNCTYLRTAMGVSSSSFGGFSFSESLSEAAGLLRYLAKTALQVA